MERLDAQGKLRTGTSNKKRASGSASVDPCLPTAGSRRVRRRGRIRVLGHRGRAGRCRRLHPSSFARLHPRTPPPLPCEWRRAPTRIRPRRLLAAGGAGSARGGGGGRGPSPARAPDSAGAAALARQGCTPEHDCAVGRTAVIVLHVCTRWRREAAAVAAAAAAAARRPLACVPALPSAGRCSSPTRVVEAHGSLLLSSSIAGSPPTPPFGLRRVRCDGRPAHPDPPSPQTGHPHYQQANQPRPHSNSSTKHMYVYVKHGPACKGMHS